MNMFLLCAGRFNNGHHYMIIGARLAWVAGWENDQHHLPENFGPIPNDSEYPGPRKLFDRPVGDGPPYLAAHTLFISWI